MINLYHLAKSANTLGATIKAALKRKDLPFALKAIETQAEVLLKIEKFAAESSNKEIVNSKVNRAIKYSKEKNNVYGPHKWFNQRW